MHPFEACCAKSTRSSTAARLTRPPGEIEAMIRDLGARIDQRVGPGSTPVGSKTRCIRARPARIGAPELSTPNSSNKPPISSPNGCQAPRRTGGRRRRAGRPDRRDPRSPRRVAAGRVEERARPARRRLDRRARHDADPQSLRDLALPTATSPTGLPISAPNRRAPTSARRRVWPACRRFWSGWSAVSAGSRTSSPASTKRTIAPPPDPPVAVAAAASQRPVATFLRAVPRRRRRVARSARARYAGRRAARARRR